MGWVAIDDFFAAADEAREAKVGPINPKERTKIEEPSDREYKVGVPPGACMDCGKPTGRAVNAKRCIPCLKIAERKAWTKQDKKRQRACLT